MVEFRSKKSGKQFLLEPQALGRTYRRASYGDDFGLYDTSGFDECFPNIAPAFFPDHGEVWSREWNWQQDGNDLHFSIDGVKARYVFEKRIRMDGTRVRLLYKVENRENTPLNFLWSAHPLLDVTPGTTILLPNGEHHMLIDWASDTVIGKHGDIVPWPFLSSNHHHINYSVVQEKCLGQAVKCYTNVLNEGWAAVYFPDADESLLFEFDPGENPYLGIWLCYGGWPAAGVNAHLTVALEPCCGRSDSLEEAMQQGECAHVDAHGTKEWSLTMSVLKGKPTGKSTVRSTILSLTTEETT